MVDSEYSMDIYKSAKISIGTVMRNPKTLKFVSDHFKTKEMCNHAVKYKTSLREKCSYLELFWAALSGIWTEYSVRMRKNADQNNSKYGHFLAVYVPDQYKTQEICDIAVSLYLSLVVYCHDKNITQKMCDEAVDNSLPALKLIPDWFVTSKMIKKLYTALYANNGLLFFDEDSGDVTFYCDEMSVLSVYLTNINLDNILMKMILILLFLSDFRLNIVNLKNAKHLKKDN